MIFYHVEYIRIFIRPISIVTNIFGYSFIQKNDIRPTLYWSSVKNWPQVQSKERAASQQQKNIISASCLGTNAIPAQFQVRRAIINNPSEAHMKSCTVHVVTAGQIDQAPSSE